MNGPQPAGFWSGKTAQHGTAFQFLIPGRRYRVVKEFTDFDYFRHLVGEEWTFLGHSFLPHEDGMSFYISLDDREEWLLPLQWRNEQQGGVLDALGEHVRAI